MSAKRTRTEDDELDEGAESTGTAVGTGGDSEGNGEDR